MLSKTQDQPSPSMAKLIHDLNNAMTGILAMSDLCLRETPQDHPHHELLKILNDSAEKSRALVTQITALHRKQNPEPPTASY